MKLLVILNDLDIGGAQNYTISLMNQFVVLGHNIQLRVLSANTPLLSRLSDKVNTIIWERKNKFDLSVAKKIRQEIRENKYDAIIASYILFHKISTAGLKNLPPTIYPIHTTKTLDRKSYLFNYILFRLKNKNEIFLTSIDNQTQQLATDYGVSKTFFKQIYNGVDTNRFILPPANFNKSSLLEKFRIDSSFSVILMVAGYREEKRHIDALKAFQLLKKGMPDVALICAGDKREGIKNELQQYITDHKISNVKLLSAAEVGDVLNFYWCADVFTLTSDKVETFSIASLEAMACGVPCVLTDVGGAKDYIFPNKNGDICQPQNIESIKEKWAYVLKNKQLFNPNEIRSHVVNQYSIEASAKNYLKIIKDNADKRS